MRYQNGWIKLHRKLLDSYLYSQSDLLQLAIYILLCANYEESWVCWHGKRRKLLPGQSLFSTRQVALKLNASQSSVERRLKRLTQDEFLTHEATHQGSIVTICNWEKYQLLEFEGDSPSDSPIPDLRLTPDSRVTQQEEGKKEFLPGQIVAEAPILPAPVLNSSPPLSLVDPNTARARIRAKKMKEPKAPTAGSLVWEAYAEAYARIYKAAPIRNQHANAMCTRIASRLGAEVAPQVAAFYCTHRDSYYVRKGHSLGPLLADCEKLHTEWVTGRQITLTLAKQVDKSASNDAVFERAAVRMRDKERQVTFEN